MPKLRNESPFIAELVPMIDRTGRNVGVVIVKATYTIGSHSELTLSPLQIPLTYGDVSALGDPSSHLRLPSDLVDYKPYSDVLLIPPAVPLSDDPAEAREISFQVGPVRASGVISSRWPWGPLRRDQEPRKRLAGTYDQAWADHRMPLLPEDFDPKFNQSAPPAQVAQYLAGDESFTIANLYKSGTALRGFLPGRAVLVAGSVLSDYFTAVAVLDTVAIFSEIPEMILVWRHVIRTRQKIEEIGRVSVYAVRLRTARELYGRP